MKEATTHSEIHRRIIEDCLQGSRKAQYALYTQYSRAMFNTCLRIMPTREEAEDVLQEAFTEAYRSLHSFRFESSFGAWLKRIVVNRCINALKKKRAALDFYEDMSQWEEVAESPEPAEHPLSVEIVRKTISRLPQGSRMVFSLYLLEGYDHKEISGILGISESTSKTQYMYARKKVRELLSTSAL